MSALPVHVRVSSPIAWRLDELPDPPLGAPRVVSTFSCGGGSSQGYKRAGCEVVAAVDIDPEMVEQYQLNFPDTPVIVKGVGDVTDDEVQGWGDVDILDGSPPCTLFSSNNPTREDHWGKAKRFREGQAEQVLDDLFFHYLALVDRVQPKLFIAENVPGMLRGNAKGYVRAVLEQAERMGYRVTLVKASASWYRVPQTRPRVFFVGVRGDLPGPPFRLPEPTGTTTCGQAFAGLAGETGPTIPPERWARRVWDANPGGGQGYAPGAGGVTTSTGFFVRLSERHVAVTVTASGTVMHYDQPRYLTPREFARLGTFADDYKFLKPESSFAHYVVGMSVPPFLAEAVARQAIALYLRPDDLL